MNDSVHQGDEFLLGITGLVFGPLGLKLGRGKLVLYSRTADGAHLTVFFETRSGELDLHRKSAAGEYESLFRLSIDRLLPVLMRAVEQVTPMFIEMLRPLRIGWLAHHGIGVVTLPRIDGGALARFGPVRERTLRLDGARMRELIVVPSSLEAIYELGGGAGVLVGTRGAHRGRVVGTAFSTQQPTGRVVAQWVKRDDSHGFGLAVIAALKTAALAESAFIAPEFSSLEA